MATVDNLSCARARKWRKPLQNQEEDSYFAATQGLWFTSETVVRQPYHPTGFGEVVRQPITSFGGNLAKMLKSA